MAYADFQDTAGYKSNHAGAGIRIVLQREDNPFETYIGFSGMTARETYEQLPVEEAGEEGVNEIVDGRHTINVSLNGFYSPEKSDTVLPSRKSFIGKRWVIFKKIGTDRPNEGQILEVVTGFRMADLDMPHGPRGNIVFTMSGPAERRWRGEEWALATGT